MQKMPPFQLRNDRGPGVVRQSERVCVIAGVSTLWSWALSPASRAMNVARSWAVPNLDLAAPPADSPVGEKEFSVRDDLEVTGVVDPARLLDLPSQGVSSAQRQFCSEVVDVISSAFASPAAPGIVRTHDAVLKSVVPNVSPKVGCPVLPMQS